MASGIPSSLAQIAATTICVELVEHERTLGAGTFGEQPDSIEHRQRRQTEDLLARYEHAFPAGDQDRDARATGDQGVDQRRQGFDDMFAIVQEQERARIAQHGDELVSPCVGAGAAAACDRRCDGFRHARWLADRREIGKGNTIGELAAHLASEMQRESCLPNTARTDNGYEALDQEELLELGDGIGASDQPGA